MDHNHARAEIGLYTKRQVLLHYRCALQLERMRRAERVMDTNMAYAGGDAAEKHFKELLK